MSDIEIATATSAGIKSLNEDAVASRRPVDEHQRQFKGVAIAIADGVSSAEAGREASQAAVTQFIEDYYKTPETWSVKQAGNKTLNSINLSLYRKSQAFAQQQKGFLCTFTGLVVKSTQGHLFSAGDSRIYRLRKGELQQLTHDHIVSLGQHRKILARAVGMDNQLVVDYHQIALEEGDLFLLCSDGIHDFLNADVIRSHLQNLESSSTSSKQLQQHAEALIQEALAAQSDDNISVALLKINHLPQQSANDYKEKLTRLPFPPPLEPGMKIDGLLVKEELFASSRSHLYLVQEAEDTGCPSPCWVMKTPSPNFEDDYAYLDRFIQEEWIGKRVSSSHIVRIVERRQPRQFLYYLMEYVPGMTLDKWIAAHPFPPPKTAFKLIRQTAEALLCLHQQDTIHQDLKPANIMVSGDCLEESTVTLLDFGSVYVSGIAEMFLPLEHEGVLGTAAYADPNLLLGKSTGPQGDLYALATIAYELFTGQLPYGDRINNCRSKLEYDRLRYRSARQFNPAIPLWFDRALEKGCAIDLDLRYRKLEDFLRDLRYPNPEFLKEEVRAESDRSRVVFWQMITGFWVVSFLLLILLFAFQ